MIETVLGYIGIFLAKTAFIWVALILAIIFVRMWMKSVQREFIDSIKWTLLEIKVPRDVHKSPAAMEIVLLALHDTGGTGHWYKRWWKGSVTAWSSLEIISVEGSIYFFVRVQSKYKDFIRSQIYSQYPQSEIKEVDDYVRYVPPYVSSNDWSMFGAELTLTQPDGYPIKTYIDYGMDKDLGMDAEQRIDPMTPLLEFLSTMTSGEQVWIQIMIRAATKKGATGLFKELFEFTGKNWVDETKDIIKEFLAKNATKVKKDAEGKKSEEIDLALLTPGKKDILTALERSITKYGFETGIRIIYLAQKSKFRGTNIGALLGLWRQYSSQHLNGFKPVGSTITDFDAPYYDIGGRRVEKRKEKMFDAYVRRAYFYGEHKSFSEKFVADVERVPFILNTEELATIFHFPSRTAETPSFERIESKKAEPPMNLPV